MVVPLCWPSPGPSTRCSAFDDFDDPLHAPGPALELAETPERVQQKTKAARPARKVDIGARAESLAKLPAAPEGLFACIGYGLTVRRRLRELRSHHRDALAAYEQARDRAVAARVELGATLHRVGSPELGALVAAVDGAAHTAEERQAQLAEMREKAAGARARHAEEIRALERELKPWHTQRGRAQAEVDLGRKELERAKAALDRVATEMEPLAGDPASLAPFKRNYDARKQETTEHRVALEGHEATLAAAQTKVGELEAGIAAVREKQSTIERELQQAEGAAEAAASDAGASREVALLTLARAALEKGLVPDDISEGRAAHGATGAEAEAALELRIATAALSVHDEGAVARGAAALGALAALGASAVLIALVL